MRVLPSLGMEVMLKIVPGMRIDGCSNYSIIYNCEEHHSYGPWTILFKPQYFSTCPTNISSGSPHPVAKAHIHTLSFPCSNHFVSLKIIKSSNLTFIIVIISYLVQRFAFGIPQEKIREYSAGHPKSTIKK